MTARLTADEPAVRAYVRRKLRALAGAACACGAVGVAILVADYRFMIFSLIAFAIPVVMLAEARVVKRRLAAPASLDADAEGLVLVAGAEQARLSVAQVALVRATPDALFVIERLAPNRHRRWIVPGPEPAVRAAAQELEARGVQVVFERGVVLTLVAALGGAIVSMALSVVTAALVIAALANLVLAAIGRGGSAWKGLGLLVAALAAAVGVQLLAALAARVTQARER
jgi:hypothetical protein